MSPVVFVVTTISPPDGRPIPKGSRADPTNRFWPWVSESARYQTAIRLEVEVSKGKWRSVPLPPGTTLGQVADQGPELWAAKPTTTQPLVQLVSQLFIVKSDAVANDGTAINLSWSPVAGATSYRISVSYDGGATYLQSTEVDASSPTAGAIDLPEQTAVTHKVEALNANGEVIATSEPSTRTTTTAPGS